MNKLEALTALRDKVKAGTLGEGRPFVGEVFIRCDKLGLDSDGAWLEKAYNGSLDAAKALHEAVLPDKIASMTYHPKHGLGIVIGIGHYSYDETPARAWLIAILESLIAQEQDT